MNSPSESTINHFSHPHTLHLSNHQNQQTLTPVSCSGCKRKATGLIYSCTACNYFLHVKCSKMPRKITHPYHKNHSFSLLPKPCYPEGFFNCKACGNKGEGFSYHCKPCGIDLHIVCASKPMSVTHQSHNHQLKLIFSPPYPNKIFNCDICDTSGSNHWLYRCEGCQFDVHVNCINISEAPVRQTHINHSQTTFGAAAPTTQPSMPQPEMTSKSAPQPAAYHQAFGAFGPQHTATGIPVQNANVMPTMNHVHQGIHGPAAMQFVPTQNDLQMHQALMALIHQQQQHYLQALTAGGGLGAGVGAGVGGFGSGVGGRVNGNGVFPGGPQQFLQALSGINNIAGIGGIPGLDLSGNGGGSALLSSLQGLMGGGNGLNVIGGDGGLSSMLGNLGGLGDFLGAFLGS